MEKELGQVDGLLNMLIYLTVNMYVHNNYTCITRDKIILYMSIVYAKSKIIWLYYTQTLSHPVCTDLQDGSTLSRIKKSSFMEYLSWYYHDTVMSRGIDVLS